MICNLVYCCVGMLMTSCFGGSTPILGRKRITLLQTIAPCWNLDFGKGVCLHFKGVCQMNNLANVKRTQSYEGSVPEMRIRPIC